MWLRALHDRMGLTSLFVTHDQAEAMEMADRVAVLRAGRIEQLDTPARLYAEPANIFVHEFLGESVRLDCRVASGLAHFDRLKLPPLPTSCPSGPAVALIRPQEIHLTPGGQAVLTRVQPVGPFWRASLQIEDETLEALLPAGGPVPPVGDRFGLDLSQARVYPAQ